MKVTMRVSSMKVSVLILIMVLLPCIVKSFDVGLLTQKINHVDHRMHAKMSNLDEMIEVKVRIKLHDFDGHLTEQVKEAVDKIVEGGVDSGSISQMMVGLRLLQEDNRELENITENWSKMLSECSNSSQEVGMSNTRICRGYEENLENLTLSVNECINIKLQMVKDNDELRNRTEKNKQTSVMNFDSTTTEQATLWFQPSVKPDEKDKQLLVLPFRSPAYQNFAFMDLDCYTIHDSPYSHLAYISAAVYLRKEEKLLAAIYTGNKIVTVHVDGREWTVIKRGVESHGMALYEEEDTVYMSTHFPRHTIAKMSTDGNFYTKIASLKNYMYRLPNEIAIDREERLLYVHDIFNIVRMTFDGHNITKILRGDWITSLALDGFGNLFYVNSGTLMKLSFEKNATFSYNRFGFHIKDLVFHDDKIFFSERIPGHRGDSARIGIIDTKENFLMYSSHRLYKRYLFGFLLLLV